MITYGLNTLAVITWGLGVSLPSQESKVIFPYPIVEFRDKPVGIAIEQDGIPTSFHDEEVSYPEVKIGFEDS